MSDFLSLTSVWAAVLTLGVFLLGNWLNTKAKAVWCNPILIGSILVIFVLRLGGVPYSEYKEAASVLTWLVLPATVSLAIPLYEQWVLLSKHMFSILAGILCGVLVSIGCVLGLSRIFHLNHSFAVSMLPKSVTSAIGMDISAQLGGISSLTVSVIILSGIIGNLLSPVLCKVLHITNPIAKGVAIGTSSHAIGTSKALEMGQIEGAMSSLAIAVAGIITAILCPLAASFLPL